MRAAAIALVALMLVGRAAPVRAEGFVSPFVGYNFGGDSGCPQISNCDDKRLNAGVAIGALGFGIDICTGMSVAHHAVGERSIGIQEPSPADDMRRRFRKSPLSSY